MDEAAVVASLLSVARTIGPKWQEHLDFWDGEPAGHYNEISVIAHHLVHLQTVGEYGEVAAIFHEVERLYSANLTNGAERLLTVGLIEDVQNITSHNTVPVGSSAYVPCLGPQTLMSWLEVHQMWGSEDT